MLDERSRLVQEKEALQAELHLAFHNYQPKATIGTGEWTTQGWTGEWPPKGKVSGHPRPLPGPGQHDIRASLN